MTPFDIGYYDERTLREFGFKSLGENVRIAKNCTIVGIQNIEIGDNVRIDGYCSIIVAGKGWLKLGSYIHIGGYCYLGASEGIEIKDFAGLSQGVRLYSRSDDYSGNYMTNPTVPQKYTSIVCGPVIIEKHVIIGSGSVVLPNVTIGEGAAIGALSFVNRSLSAWGMYFGSPLKKLPDTVRSRKLLDLEAALNKENRKNSE